METRETLERVERSADAARSQERHDRLAALAISVLAAALAIASLAGNAAASEALLAQGKASDAWNEFQANSLKRHLNEDDAALLRLLGAGTPVERQATARAEDLEKAVREKYRPAQDQLMEKATHLEGERDAAESRHHGFQLAEAAFQIAIVLGSVSIVARTPQLLAGSAALGVVGVLLALNAALALVRP